MFDDLWAWIKSLFGGSKVTKIDMVWGRAELILSVLAYEWWKLKESEIEEYCEFAVANGYTAVGNEVAGEAGWWPKDRKSFKDEAAVKRFLFDCIDALVPWVKHTKKRGLKLKLFGINSNFDFCQLIRSAATLKDVIDYSIKVLGADNLLYLAINERDGDLFGGREKMALEVIAHAESKLDKRQTVAHGSRRSDAAFTELHPSRPGAVGGSGWSTLVVGDNGGHLKAIKIDGVTGGTPNEAKYESAYVGYIKAGYSTELYDFWTNWKKHKALLARIGKAFREKHGKR